MRSGQVFSALERVGLLPAKEFSHQAHNNLKEAWHLRVSFLMILLSLWRRHP